jgi:hypothetical protein
VLSCFTECSVGWAFNPAPFLRCISQSYSQPRPHWYYKTHSCRILHAQAHAASEPAASYCSHTTQQRWAHKYACGTQCVHAQWPRPHLAVVLQQRQPRAGILLDVLMGHQLHPAPALCSQVDVSRHCTHNQHQRQCMAVTCQRWYTSSKGCRCGDGEASECATGAVVRTHWGHAGDKSSRTECTLRSTEQGILKQGCAH